MTIDNGELYDRQAELDLVNYDKVLVIGVGGIGSWVALDLALSGCVNEITVCDSDVLENSNLNRTPYCRRHIGMGKVWAIRDIVEERRHDVMVIPVKELVQNSGIEKDDFDFVIDCSDGIRVKEWALSIGIENYVKLGYDGWSVTMDFTKVMPWEEGEDGYRIVPSFVVPPQILAGLVTGILLSGEIPKDVVKTFSVHDILDRM